MRVQRGKISNMDILSFLLGEKMIEEVIAIVDNLIEDMSVITANRLSILNGKDDITEFYQYIEENDKLLFERYSNLEEKDSTILAKCVIQILLAEIYYQKDDCYNSLVMVNSTLAFLEQEGNENIWIVGKFFQMCIMIVTGQVSAIYPLVDGMESRIYKTKNQQLICNYEALRAWCALYDDEKDTINNWMANEAPNEYGEIRLEDTFAYMVKSRIYYMQQKYFANYTLLNSLINILESNNRYMELCETYMLLALNFYSEGKKVEAYKYFEKSLKIASERKFIRLLADEGEDLFRLAKSYRREKAIRDEFLNTVVNASKEMALKYPQYLKKYKANTPQMTKKEKEILVLLADGRSNMEIAEFLENTPNTIKHHMKNIFIKLEVNSRAEAVEVAKREMIIP